MATTDGAARTAVPGAPQALALTLLLVGATLSLTRLFQGNGAVLPFVLVILSALGLAALLRRFRVGTPLALALMAPGFIVVAAILLFPETLLVVVPTPATLTAMAHAVPTGLQGMNDQAAPVVLTREFLLLACALVWVDATVADALTFRAGRPLLALLPALGLLIYPAAIRGVHPIWYVLWFMLGAAAVLAAEGRARVAGWGVWVSAADARPATVWRLPLTPAAGTARWLLTAAAVCGLLAPWLLPGWGKPALMDFRNPIGPVGSYTINPFVTLTDDLRAHNDAVLFTVRASSPSYWRLLTLDQFDGTTFSSSANPAAARPFTGSTTGDTVLGTPTQPLQQTIHIDLLGGSFLPIAAAPAAVSVPGYQVLQQPTSRAISIGRRLPAGLTYTATSLVPEPSVNELQAAGETNDAQLGQYLGVHDVDPAVRQLAQRIVAAVHATTYFARALAIQDYLRGPLFRYTLDPRGLTGPGNQLDAFLFRVRAGYCQQFAAAMAVLAREVGIPSRVAVGFTTGTREGHSQVFVVHTSDAHAWPELFFSGIGWVRFEPTPRGDGTVLQPAYTSPAALGGQTARATGQPGKSRHFTQAHRIQTPSDLLRGSTPGGPLPARVAHPGFHPPTSGLGLVLAIALVLAALVPVVKAGTWAVRRRRSAGRPRSAVRAAYGQLDAWAVDAGIGRAPAETPAAYARRLLRELGPRPATRARRPAPDLSALQELTTLYLRAEYDRPEPSAADAARARELARGARRELAARVGLQRRLQAVLSPRSLFGRALDESAAPAT